MPLRGEVAALDALRERNLVGGGQQLVPADVGQEELKAVGRADDRVGIRLLGLFLLGGLLALSPRLADLEADRLELTRELLDLLLAEVVLDGEGLELYGLDMTALLTLLDEGARLFAL